MIYYIVEINKFFKEYSRNDNKFSIVAEYRINLQKSIALYISPTNLQRRISWTHSHSL